MTSDRNVRRYRPDDAARVRTLHVEALRDVGAFFADAEFDAELDDDLTDVAASYLDADGEFLVGTVDGRVVAMGAFRPPGDRVRAVFDGLPDGTAELKRMRVDPAHQRRGHGQAVLDELERRAADRGYETLVLDVTERQDAARRFYETNGFVERERVEVTAFEEPFVQCFYEKSLE
ncbi:GNAT family N-acetyltransferase [Haloarchaeobius sp. HRN-SO-5]|uniref:GNAT family N-acetyltransferase n=1 Tax=Haloarchaeobius sp. HRN-SO-5 TaxID=3446118 RepID=UPI003EB90273